MMEQKVQNSKTPPRPCRPLSAWSPLRVVAAGLIAVALLGFQSFKPLSLTSTHAIEDVGLGRQPKQEDTTWVGIKPSRVLEWHACYSDEFDCARLDVPMDWLDPSEDADLRVVLAIIRLRAANTTASDYRGSLFFNPGGPGGSGVWALRDHGKFLQTVAGANHDIVSFDPRGIGASVPRIECWNTKQDRAVWNLQDVGVIDAHPGTMWDAFARAKAFSRSCEGNLGGEGILRHSSTTYHARDMLEILDQMNQPKLRYWGFSYGTVLGGTFAAMYPDRVERLVSDGNVDYKEWYYGQYINFLHDTDRVLDAFFEFCFQAGPMSCMFHAPSPAAIKQRLETLLETLRQSPVIIEPSLEGGPKMPELVTYSEVKRMISTALYQPIFRFRRVAQVLASLEAGDGKPYFDYTSPGGPNPSTFCSAETVPPTVPISGPREEGTDDAFPAIMCSDALMFNQSLQEVERYSQELLEISSAAGAVQIAFRLACVGRTIRPKWRFAGPFGGNTSHPILFIANVADNVTPHISATNNSAGFPGSVVLVQNSYGHTSLSAASTCTARYIHDYFQDGTLPDPGTLCEPNKTPFELAFGEHATGAAEVGNYADELTFAVEQLARNADWSLHFRPPRI